VALGYCRKAFKLNVRCKKIKLICLYCGKAFIGREINRLKHHLAEIKGK
jgi:hypothetical protein